MKRFIPAEHVNRLQLENMAYPETLIQIPKRDWPAKTQDPRFRLKESWRSRYFLVQIFHEDHGIERLSINRCAVDDTGDWKDGISWDELQALKNQCGRGDREAVEIYPPDRDIVNVANIRHLWVLPEPLPFGWRKK